MSIKQKNVPRLRFPGFTDAWERQSVKDSFLFIQNNTLSRAELSMNNGCAKNIHYGDILVKFGEYLEVSKTDLPYIKAQRILEKYRSSLLRDGDIIMADTAEDETVGKCTEIAELHGSQAISGLHTIPMRPKANFASGYLGYYMNSKAYHDQLFPLMQGIKVTSVSKSAIQGTNISFPRSVAEQDAIGKCFIRIDTLITLQQRKLDQIKEYKKGMLQKMFPKDGESVPEVRFPGFTGEWERRKFKDAFEFLQNNTLSRAELSHDGGVAKNIHYGDILVKFGEYFDASEGSLPYITSQMVVEKFKSSFLQDGDVIMADTAEDETVGKCTEVAGLQGFPTVSGLHTIPLRPKKKFASGYLGYYLNSGAYHDQLLPLIQGTKVSSVSKSSIQNTEIMFPSDIAEQAAIGRCFIGLDNLITLHQRKLEAMKEYKKGLLQQMFV